MFCQFWSFHIFVKYYPLPTFLCKIGTPGALNHPCEAFTFSHSSPSCIAYNGVSITRRLVTMATATVALDRSKRIPAQVRFKRRLTTRTHFFSYRMALERGKSTKDAVNKSCWRSMGVAITRALTELRIVHCIWKCPVNNFNCIQTRNNMLLLLQAFDVITLQRYTLYQCIEISINWAIWYGV